MKKLICLILVFAFAFCICGCGTSSYSYNYDVDEEYESEPETIEEEEAEESAEVWIKKFYVDEFQEETDKWYIEGSFMGKFNNSATTGSLLMARVLVDWEDKVSIFLHEYGNSNPVKNVYSESKNYTIKIKDEYGNIYEMEGYMPAERGDRVLVSDAYKSQFIDLLSEGGTHSVYMVNQDYSTSQYTFEIKSANFSEAYY